jgi:uroporphyrinogen-III synthase
VALTSGAALANLVAGLPAAARGIFLAGTAVVSSARLAAAARAAGFKRTLEAPSPGMDALIARIAADLA